jgi:hypothetical protein
LDKDQPRKEGETYEFCHVEPNRFYVKFFERLQAFKITSGKVILLVSWASKMEPEDRRTHCYKIKVLWVVEARMQRKDKVVSVELREGGLLVDDHAGQDFLAIRNELVDDFESIEMRWLLLPNEVNGSICSRTQRP